LNKAEDSLRRSFDAVPESVSEARRAFALFADQRGMAEPAIDDLKTIVTEASSNVVRHAYPKGGGTFEVEASVDREDLVLVVRDFGQGVRPHVETEPRTLRLGLGLISALSSRFEISGGIDAGTELRMRIPMRASQRERRGCSDRQAGRSPARSAPFRRR
jgi:anti-sigma regulatory factor (Ser/Thr protein kinase)